VSAADAGPEPELLVPPQRNYDPFTWNRTVTDDILPAAADAAGDRTGYDVFLSYRRSDREVTTQLRQWLESRGKRVFMDTELPTGFPWVQPLEQALEESRAVAVLVGPTGFGNWQRREIDWALNRQTGEGDGRFPVLPVLLPQSQRPERAGFLSLNTWVDLRDGLNEAGLSALMSALGDAPEKNRVSTECPYRGLAPFTEDDGP
jgi:TIR domain